MLLSDLVYRTCLECFKELIDKVSKPTNFDLPLISFDLPPIRFNKKMNLFNQSSECPPAAKATVNVDINTEATVFAKFSIYASGTVSLSCNVQSPITMHLILLQRFFLTKSWIALKQCSVRSTVSTIQIL